MKPKGRKCIVCQGKGKHAPGHPCAVCEGKGRIVPTAPAPKGRESRTTILRMLGVGAADR